MVKTSLPKSHKISFEGRASYSNVSNCFSELKKKDIQLRLEINFWKFHFEKARQREEELKEEIEALKGRVRYLERQIYSRKTEKSRLKDISCNSDNNQAEKRKRGQQPGTCGHGRRNYEHLPLKTDTLGFDEYECFCPICSKPFFELPCSDDSEQIEIEVSAYRRKVRKTKYKKTCQCPEVPGIITKPGQSKLISKSRFGISVWEKILIEKYLYQHPVNRILASLSTYDVSIAPGTVGDGLKRLAPLFSPIEGAIHEKSISEKWWHADETRWMVFELFGNKQNYKWYLWVFVSKSAVVYIIASSRSTEVVEEFFGAVKAGILCVDRYSSYKCFVRTRKGFVLAFCWAHVRRDFLDVGKSWPKLEDWALDWVNRIGMIFHLNNLRLQHKVKTKGFKEADKNLRRALSEMEKHRDEELTLMNLHIVCRKALESLKNHWEGLTVFVKHPHIPMDNSEAERRMRPGAVGRKNYYGSGAIWSAYCAASLFSIFQTLLLWSVNPRKWLTGYLQACAENDGRAPQDISGYLPWNMPEEKKKSISLNPQYHDTS
jgi:transposase